ncbi:MAG: D-aminoacyl-tRNA deacylase, partial [Candidatus Woesearchaeota archaeon]
MIDELNISNGFKHPFKKDNISLSFIFSYSDQASINIFNDLKSKLKLSEVKSSNNRYKKFKSIYKSYNLIFYGFNESLINLDNIDLKGDSFIFLSKHSSKSKKPCLTVHTTGNFSKAQFGGVDNKISEPDPFLHKLLISSLNHISNK